MPSLKHRARFLILLTLAGSLLIAGFIVLRQLARANAYSGPGVRGNLIQIEIAKARWLDAHPQGGEWPTKEDLLPYLTSNSNTSFAQIIRPRNREIYIINKIGAPVIAFYPKTERIITVTSNDWAYIESQR